jgi:argininosuccinate lyase
MNGKETAKPVWSERMGEEASSLNILFCAGRDVIPRTSADELLIPYDIWTNKVHCLMLMRQKIISPEVLKKILRSLEKLQRLYLAGRFKLDPQKEDVHINIESFVTQDAGEQAGGSMHTARSRNDQTTTDVRLYVRDRLIEQIEGAVEIARSLLNKAAQHTATAMPGFTHMRPAALTTFGHFLCAHAQALLRDLDRMKTAFQLLNQCPLGAVAAFGTSWPIDRNYAASLLGFEAVQENSLDCVTNRWEMEAHVAVSLSFLMNHLSTFAQDLLLLSMPQIGYVAIAEKHLTGSSVMPQKQNLDFAEVTRAKASLVLGCAQALFGIAKACPSGYNRDSQWSKYLIMDVFDELHFIPRIYCDVIDSLRPNAQRMLQGAMENFVHAADMADFLAQTRSLPFRTAYHLVARAIKTCEPDGRMTLESFNEFLKADGQKFSLAPDEWNSIITPDLVLQRRRSLGAPNPDLLKAHIERMRTSARETQNWIKQKNALLERAKRKLAEEVKKLA